MTDTCNHSQPGQLGLVNSSQEWTLFLCQGDPNSLHALGCMRIAEEVRGIMDTAPWFVTYPEFHVLVTRPLASLHTDVLQSPQAFPFRIHVLRCPPLGRWLGKRIAVPSGHFGWMLAVPERTWLKPLTLRRAGFRKTDLLIQIWYEAPLYSKIVKRFCSPSQVFTNLFILSSFFSLAIRPHLDRLTEGDLVYSTQL